MKNAIKKFYEFIGQPLFGRARIVLVVLCVPLVLSFFFPLWNITLDAPQYPHGLYIDIWGHKLEGGNDGQHIEEINTLNHYIGMRTLNEEDFKDLDWIPFAIGIFVILALRVAVIGNVRSLIDLAVLNAYFTLFALGRFVYQLYVYGHDLDPRAPIDIEPFMPVVFGSQKVANFTTSSYPRLGSVFLGIFAIGLWVTVFWHLISGRRAAKRAEELEAEAMTEPAHPSSASGEGAGESANRS